MAWLRWLTNAELADSIAGDLEEERRRRATRSPLGARLWWCRRSLAISAYLLSQRIRAGAVDLAARLVAHATSFGGDIRHACRALRRTPWYALTVVGVIALGMAMAATVFAVVDGVLFKPLPLPRLDELAAIDGGWSSRPELLGGVTSSPSDLVAWRTAAPEVRFASYSAGGREQLDAGEHARSAWVSENFFDVLGQHPLVGGFRPEHFKGPNPIQPAVITYLCWQRRFAGDPSIVGRIIRGDRGTSVEVVGIMAPDFLYPSTNGRFVPEVLTPLVERADAATDRGRGVTVFARMPAGMSVAALQGRLSAATADLALRLPRRPDERGIGPWDMMRVQPLEVTLRSASRRTFTTVFLAASVLVLLACLNVTGLAAARVADRWRELTLRRALGGTSGDLVRLLGAESFVVVGMGSTLGVLGSFGLVKIVARFLPESLVLFRPLAVDARVVGFTVMASALCAAVTTLWPARAALGASLRPALADSRGTTRPLRATSRFVLVSAQVAIGLVMTVGGALLAGSLARVSAEDPGYRADRTFHIWISNRVPPTWPLIEGLLDDVRRVRAVSAAGGSNVPFLQRSMMGSSFAAPAGAVEESDVESPGVTHGFFEAMGIRLAAGRLPSERELRTGAPVVVVSERVARDYWRGGSVIGQTLVRRGKPFTVVGIVADARYLALDIDPDGAVYYPLGADDVPSMINLFVRFDGTGPADLPSVLSLISSRYPTLRLRSAQHVATTLGDSVRTRRFQTLIFSAFALAALVIVGIGVFGLVAIVTSRRTREIGVRMALGSRPRQIAWMIMRQELTAVAFGLAAGSLVAVWAVGFVRAYLYKTSVYDPSIWLLAAAALLTVAAAGALLPALRASLVDPISALRVD